MPLKIGCSTEQISKIGPGDYEKACKWEKYGSIKGSFSFASNTKREFLVSRALLPGPGAYNNPLELNVHIRKFKIAKELKEQLNSQQRLLGMLQTSKAKFIEDRKQLMINIFNPRKEEGSHRRNYGIANNINIVKTIPKQFHTLLLGKSIDNN